MYFDVKATGNKSTRNRTLIKLLKSTDIKTSASGMSNTIFSSSDLDELCDKLNLLLQKKQAGSNSDIINGEIVAILDKLIDYKSISKKQHKQISTKSNPLHK